MNPSYPCNPRMNPRYPCNPRMNPSYPCNPRMTWTHATYATRAWTYATYATALFSWLNFIYIQTGNFHVILKLELKTSEERNIKLNMKLTAFGKTWMPKIGNPMSHKYLNNIHCPCQLWVWGRPQESPIIICNCYSNILLLRNLSFKEPLMHVALPFMSK